MIVNHGTISLAVKGKGEYNLQMNQKKIGLFIRDLRKEKGMSQKQFAVALNVSESAVCKWEKGVNLPDTFNLQTISDMFQVTVNELLNGERMPVPDMKLNQETEAASQSESEPTLKPEPVPTPVTGSAESDNPPRSWILHWRKILALCSLCIAGLLMIAFMVWFQGDSSPQFTIVESYYGASDEFYADAYGFKQVYWIMVEYTGELTQDSIQDFSNTLSRKFNEESKLENVDAVFFEFYEDYSPTTLCDQDFIVFLPLAGLDNIIY